MNTWDEIKNAQQEVERKFVFWVVYDATGDRQFIKMDSETGCLAMFDNEESAASFASGLDGVGYKEVVLYQLPPETSKKPEEGCDMSDLVKRLRIKAGMIEMGELIARRSDSALMREAADALEMAEPAVQGEPVGYVSPLLLKSLRSGKACGITMEDKPDAHNGVTIPLYTAELQLDTAPAAHGPLFLSDEKILEIASNPMVTPCSTWWLKNDVKAGDVQNSAVAFARAVLKTAAPGVQMEVVGWQFYQDGKWWNGDDRIKDHRKNTVAAGIPVRDVYTTPKPAEQQPDVTLLLELLSHARCNTCDGSGGLYDNHGHPHQCQWCHDRSKALAAYLKQGGKA